MTIERTTIARPYAKAAFEFARDNQQLAAWSALLARAAIVSRDTLVEDFLGRPQSTTAQHFELFQSVCAQVSNPSADNFLHELADEHRLGLLPEISAMFDELRADYEKTVDIQVDSFDELTREQQQKLSEKFEKRLKRRVSLNVTINKKILGGVRVSYGDHVIDDTVISKLKNMAIALVS